MKKKFKIFILILVLVVIALVLLNLPKEKKDPIVCDDNIELVFNTGFEGTTYGEPVEAIEKIYGIDNTIGGPNDWNDLYNHPYVDSFSVYYTNGNPNQRNATLVSDPLNRANQVLKFWLNEATIKSGGEIVKGRVQGNINTKCFHEFYNKVRLYIDDSVNILTKKEWSVNDFLMLQEYWNEGNWTGSKFPYRISVQLTNEVSSQPNNLNFQVHGQITRRTSGFGKHEEIWREVSNFPVPVNTWMTLETYILEGDAETGRFYIAVIPDGGSKQVLFDITNYTHHPDQKSLNGFLSVTPLKLYVKKELIDYVRDAGESLTVYWDDWQVWRNLKPSN